MAQRELAGAEAQGAALGRLEARYWHDFNDLQAQLRAHVDERDALLRKARAAAACFSRDFDFEERDALLRKARRCCCHCTSRFLRVKLSHFS